MCFNSFRISCAGRLRYSFIEPLLASEVEEDDGEAAAAYNQWPHGRSYPVQAVGF